MIYTGEFTSDYNNILRHINEFTEATDLSQIQIDTLALKECCVGMSREFPHCDGLDKASVFKKMGNFVAHFLYFQPIKSSFSASYKIDGLDEYNSNAVIALDIAITCIEHSSISQLDKTVKKVATPLYLSNHSYADVIDALSEANIKPETHYKLLTVFFEQLTYKTNRDCEYLPDPVEKAFYPGPYHVTGGDDMTGL